MRINALGRAHIKRREGAQPVAGQMRMNSACGQDHRHRNTGVGRMMIGQHDMTRTRTHSIFSLRPDPLQRGVQSAVAFLKGTIDLNQISIEILHQSLELGVAHKGAVHDQNLGLGTVLIQHVLQVAKAGLQAHDTEFAQAINRRIGDLTKVLTEEMGQRTVLLGQHSRRGVIAHRGQSFLGILSHRNKNLFNLFNSIASSDLTLAQIRAAKDRNLGGGRQHVVQFFDLANPIAKRLIASQTVLHLTVMEQAALLHIDSQQLTGAKGTLLNHGCLINRNHSSLGSGNQHAVASDDITHRAQTIAIKTSTDPTTIGHRQGSRTIPRLHDRIAIGIHIAPRLGQLDGLLGPRLWDQHGLGHRGRTTGTDQNLKHGIKGSRIRRPARDNRLNVFSHIAKGGRGHADLVGLHPVQIALQGVDLTVVGQHAKRLGQPPLGEGIGRIALVINGKGALKAFVHQIREEHSDLFSQHHTLVDDRTAGQRRQIKVSDIGIGSRFLNPATDDIKLTLKGLLVHTFGI